MAVKYIRLWELLLDKGMKKTDLKTEAGISSNVLAKLGKDEYVSMETMEKLCTSPTIGFVDGTDHLTASQESVPLIV